MAAAATQNDLRLSPLTGFLTLAPTVSASYPTHQRSKSTTVVDAAAAQPFVSQTSDVLSAAVLPEKVIDESASAAAIAAPALPTEVQKDLELKLRRSSSLSSEGSNGASKKWRFLTLGPVHHGEHAEGASDWSEEIAVSE